MPENRREVYTASAHFNSQDRKGLSRPRAKAHLGSLSTVASLPSRRTERLA